MGWHRYVQHKGALDALDLADMAYDFVRADADSCGPSLSLAGRRKKSRNQTIWFYGGAEFEGGETVDPAKYAAMLLTWWAVGADGGLSQWECCYSGGRDTLNPLSSVVWGSLFGSASPLASPMLKIQRSAVQLIEYMMVLAKQPGWSREAVTRAVLSRYDPRAVPVVWAFNAPFANLSTLVPTTLRQLKEDLARTITDGRPPAGTG